MSTEINIVEVRLGPDPGGNPRLIALFIHEEPYKPHYIQFPIPETIPGHDYQVNYTPNERLIINPVVKGRDNPDPALLGGFHTLCADVGEIPGHPLSGYHAGDILPLSVWDIHWNRAGCLCNDGMVYDPVKNLWVDIYLPSGTGIDTKSTYGGKISNNRKYADFEADGRMVGKRLMTHEEFSSIAEGSNELARIAGREFPGTTGGHRDQNGRRMISNIGCEDCCGVVWQWLSTPDPDIPEEWTLIAGGSWADSAGAGSRCRGASNGRVYASGDYGARFVAEPLYFNG